MNPESAQRVEALCLEALSKAEPDRGAFLEHACGGDDALRREVESLLAGRSAAGGFLETPAWAAATPFSPGTHLGPFEIQAAIGAGGMGEVYKAKDTRLDRTVAIKVLPPEFNADPERRARVEREACAIAALNHPNVLTTHDVGTCDGSHDDDGEARCGRTRASLQRGIVVLVQSDTRGEPTAGLGLRPRWTARPGGPHDPAGRWSRDRPSCIP